MKTRRKLGKKECMTFYKELYENQLFTDFKIVTNDKFVFNVHRSVLYFSSSYFKTLFLSQTKENFEKKINFRNICKKQMNLILRYIYGYEVELLDEDLLDILFLADMLDFKCLFAKCSGGPLNCLKVNN